MTSSGSIMDLSTLHKVIKDRGLPYRIGARTPGDGNCFLSSILQNILHCVSLGTWPPDVHVPVSVDDLRVMAINHMVSNKSNYVGQREVNGRREDGPMTNEQFNRLIAAQSRLDSYCDEDGWMVQAVCQCLDVELTIVHTNISSDILTSGLGGPVKIINKSEDDNSPRLKFYVGFIRINNQEGGSGHYQFIFHDRRGEHDTFIMPAESFPLPNRNRGKINFVKNSRFCKCLPQVSC